MYTLGHVDSETCGLKDVNLGRVWTLGRVKLACCKLGDMWTQWCPERACQQYLRDPSIHGSD